MSTHGVRGYTLVEILATLSIALILFAIGTPSFLQLIEDMRQRNAIFGLTTLLQQGRASAVTTGYRTLICSLDENNACLKDWSGKKIAVATDINGNRRHDDNEPIIYELCWDPSKIRISWGTNALEDPSITFQPIGTVVANGTLSLMDGSGKVFAKLIINTGGRVRLEKIKS